MTPEGPLPGSTPDDTPEATAPPTHVADASDLSPDLPPSAADTLGRIRGILAQSRRQALSAVNLAMVQAYWHIGREIAQEEQRGAQRAQYGARLIEMLAQRLTAEFGKGFIPRNLWYMRDFYRAFPIVNALRSELSWTHYRLLSRIDSPDARQFYLHECAQARWSTRELERQINSLLFERLALSRDKEGVKALAQRGQETFTPADLVKDPYVLEFVGLPERSAWQEGELEQALMDRLQAFLLELGRDFFFVARQKRLTIEGDHFYVDLVFYHRALRCFVLIDLKVGKLTQQDLGQMLLYTGYFEQEELREGENPPVGLILCTDKNEAVVRYTLSQASQQVFASRYKLHLPSEEELRRELVRGREQILTEQRLAGEQNEP